jgi:hypothetical protein
MLGIFSRLDRGFPRYGLKRRLSRVIARRTGPVSIRLEENAGFGRHGYFLRKERGAIAVGVDIERIRRDPELFLELRHRTPVAIATFAATLPGIAVCRAEFSDGEESGPGTVSFCSADPSAILIPDPGFYLTRGYDAFRKQIAAEPRPWRERDDTVLWRGSTTGIGLVAADDMSKTNTALIQRVRMCLMLRGASGVDAKLSGMTQSPDPVRDRHRLVMNAIYGRRIEPIAWIDRKFAIDIDGNTNAWTNLFQRLLLGCCVIKVASPSGFRQWYYDELVPWRHYVPVRADMSDLVEQIGWCREHPSECEAIAAEGQALAFRMTFEREFARGVRNVNRALAPAADQLFSASAST